MRTARTLKCRAYAGVHGPAVCFGAYRVYNTPVQQPACDLYDRVDCCGSTYTCGRENLVFYFEFGICPIARPRDQVPWRKYSVFLTPTATRCPISLPPFRTRVRVQIYCMQSPKASGASAKSCSTPSTSAATLTCPRSSASRPPPRLRRPPPPPPPHNITATEGCGGPAAALLPGSGVGPHVRCRV